MRDRLILSLAMAATLALPSCNGQVDQAVLSSSSRQEVTSGSRQASFDEDLDPLQKMQLLQRSTKGFFTNKNHTYPAALVSVNGIPAFLYNKYDMRHIGFNQDNQTWDLSQITLDLPDVSSEQVDTSRFVQIRPGGDNNSPYFYHPGDKFIGEINQALREKKLLIPNLSKTPPKNGEKVYTLEGLHEAKVMAVNSSERAKGFTVFLGRGDLHESMLVIAPDEFGNPEALGITDGLPEEEGQSGLYSERVISAIPAQKAG